MSRAQTAYLTYDDETRAVELARESVESYVLHGQREQPGSMRDAFYARTGAFARIRSTRGCGRLRGYTGAHRGKDRPGHAIVDAAIKAASGDSCQTEIEAPELLNLNISAYIINNYMLTNDPVVDIEPGTHGIAIDAGGTHDWTYPTLSVELGRSKEKFLTNACRKVGLSLLAWQDDDTMITPLKGQVFRERDDGGSIEAL